MSAFPSPPNERSRLRLLESLGPLDAPADKFVDAVATSAAAIANAPIGAVTFVGHDAMLVKSGVGLSAGLSVPRSDAFCSHTIVGSKPLVIANLLLDARFCDSPLVTSAPHARFYAGFPLVVQGHSIGALCVVDDRPRTLSSEQAARLERLAQGAAAWIALRKSALQEAT